MVDEASLKYSKTHEWAAVAGDVWTIGITRYAVEQLTDLVFIELPAKGKKVSAGGSFGVIESVKHASDLYSPIAGEVVDVNTDLVNDPTLLSGDAYGKGWMIRVRVSGTPATTPLLDKAGYDAFVSAGGH